MSLETDEELAGYALIHCRTERALFHKKDVVRLYGLAGIIVDGDKLPEFVAMHEDTVEPLIELWRKAHGR